MPITPDRMTRLREFGLSEYAARAYLALLDLGVAEARDVSTLSKVPQAKIYHVLEQLHEKGLAVILPEFPKKYSPVPFSEYLDRLHDEHERAADAITRDREILADMFRVMGDTEVGNRGFFTVIRGRRNVMTKLAEMTKDAKRDLLVLGTSGFASRYQSLLHELRGARERGVVLRGLLPLSGETMSKLEALAPLMEIRARDIDEGSQSSRVAIVIMDDQRAFLINFLPDDENVYTGKDVGVFTDQEAMVAALATIVEPHWHRARTLDARRDELTTGRMPDETRVLATREEARVALEAAIARGAREIRVLDSHAASAPTPTALALAERLRAAGARYRAALNVTDVDTGRALAGVVETSPGSEVRHLALRVPTRYWTVDDREAFFSLTADGPDADALVVHTTSPSVLRSLRAQFDSVWARAMPLGKRVEELEVFPHLQPRDVGMGRLFDEIKDPILVADASGRILLWNGAATRALGHDVAEALKLRVGDVIPDALPAVREATGGAASAPVETSAITKEGEPLAVELTALPARDSKGAATFAILMLRILPPATAASAGGAAAAAAAARKRLDVRSDESITARRTER